MGHRSGRARSAGQLRGRLVQNRGKQRWIWALAGISLVAVLSVGVLLARRNQGGELTGLAHYTYVGGQHAEGALTYTETPPVGGVHNLVWLNCGSYDTPVPNQNAVHSMEHGAVWITYQPDLPPADRATLRALVQGHDHILLSPYPGLPAKIVASAWNVQLKIERADDPRLRTFIRTYEGATQAPESGASCRGGIGMPQER